MNQRTKEVSIMITFSAFLLDNTDKSHNAISRVALVLLPPCTMLQIPASDQENSTGQESTVRYSSTVQIALTMIAVHRHPGPSQAPISIPLVSV